jgi:hypothetical protein
MSDTHHIIKAMLYPNTMKNAKGKFLARTSKHTSYNIRGICESIREKSGIVNTDTLEYHVKLFLDEMAELLETGNKINTGYFSAQANVKGSFDTMSDNFDEVRHRVEISFSSGHLIRQRAARLKAEILRINPVSFSIDKITDAQTKLITDKLVWNRLLVIHGEKIKVAGNDPAVGVYFVNTENGSETHLPVPVLYENSHATLKLFVPELASGTYHLKVTTQFTGNAVLLAQTRSFLYPHMLHVD